MAGRSLILTILASLSIVKKKKEEKVKKVRTEKKEDGKKMKRPLMKEVATETQNFHRYSHLYGGKDETSSNQTSSNEKWTQTGNRTQTDNKKTEEKIRNLIRTEEDAENEIHKNLYEKLSRQVKHEKKRQQIMARKREIEELEELEKERRKKWFQKMKEVDRIERKRREKTERKCEIQNKGCTKICVTHKIQITLI